jgi:hypothetical protein
MKKVKSFLLSGQFLKEYRLAVFLWFGLASIAALLAIIKHNSSTNNYAIFRQVFYHTLQQQNLYAAYPLQYGDVNLYGPIFSIVIAPFALLPYSLGAFIWVFFGALVLFYAIMQLPIKKEFSVGIIIVASLEMMNVGAYFQSNSLIAACIILGFVYINKGKEVWALFFILLATFIKIYGIVGLAFFFFSKNKMQFIGWFVIWSLLFFVSPMSISSVSFIIQSYQDWFIALVQKNDKNIVIASQNYFQDISVMGMIKRIFKIETINNIFIYVPAMIFFLLQYLQPNSFKDIRYRLYLLCSVLLMVVIFSTSSESSTYIIAFPAICLWYFLQNKTTGINIFFLTCFLITSLSYSDLLTPYVRTHIMRPYSLKALPSFITWVIIVIQMYKKQFLQVHNDKIRIYNRAI